MCDGISLYILVVFYLFIFSIVGREFHRSVVQHPSHLYVIYGGHSHHSPLLPLEPSTWSNRLARRVTCHLCGQAFGYGVLPGGDADEVEIPNNIDVNTLV